MLFLGNSLTAANNLPGLVQAMAAAGGIKLHVVAVNPGGYSLEDHWNNRRTRQVFALGKWDYVVFQQGPSSLAASQVNLRAWALRWAELARRRKARPALYMVWPFQGQAKGFELVSQSYRRAARASKAGILPAGEAWFAALRADPTIPLYTKDKLHPTVAGSYLAALVITRGLTGLQPARVPARLKLASGVVAAIPEAQAAKLRRAAEQVRIE